MKRISLIGIVILLYSCSSISTNKSNTPLYEVLTQQNDGGASIRFFEILTESKEIQMLLNDDHLKKKINTNDIKTCNYIILNLGEKSSTGYSIEITSIVETPDKIIIETKEKEPIGIIAEQSEFVNPYSIVKINSKKEIVIK